MNDHVEIADIRNWQTNPVTKEIMEGIQRVQAACKENVEQGVRDNDISEANFWLGQADALAQVLNAAEGLIASIKSEAAGNQADEEIEEGGLN